MPGRTRETPPTLPKVCVPCCQYEDTDALIDVAYTSSERGAYKPKAGHQSGAQDHIEDRCREAHDKVDLHIAHGTQRPRQHAVHGHTNQGPTAHRGIDAHIVCHIWVLATCDQKPLRIEPQHQKGQAHEEHQDQIGALESDAQRTEVPGPPVL